MRFLHDKCKPHNGDKSSMKLYSYFYLIQEISRIYAIMQKLRLPNGFVPTRNELRIQNGFSPILTRNVVTDDETKRS